MYKLKAYKAKDKEAVLDFIDQHPFASITSCTQDGEYYATQLPLLLRRTAKGLYLEGHLMRDTDHYRAFVHTKKVLVLFTGPHCYVSASWYKNPYSGSTWNYMSVQAKGSLQIMNDDDLLHFMDALTLKYENHNASSPTYLKNLPDKYVRRLMPMIAGIRIKVDDLDHTFKLSQDKDKESFANIIKALENADAYSKLVAEEMLKLNK